MVVGSGSMGGRTGVEVNYDYYDSTTHRVGTVLLTQEMYDAEHWFLFANEDGTIYYYTNDTGTFYFNWQLSNGSPYVVFGNSTTDYNENPYMYYDVSTETWKSSVCSKSKFKNLTYFNPSSIMKQKGMHIFYYDLGTSVSPDWYCPPVDFPFVSNLNDIALGNFENVYVSVQDCFNYGALTGDFNSGTMEVTNTYKVYGFKIILSEVETGKVVYNGDFASISESSVNFQNIDDVYYLVIPKSDFVDYNFIKGNKYSFSLKFDFNVYSTVTDVRYGFLQKYHDEVVQEFVYGENIVPDKDDENTDKIINSFTNSIGEQTDAIKEQTEVNKNIFQKIGDILSYINPFSENFFVYKLIELLIEMLKGLFIPSNEFFSSYFSELNDWFSDRFGFLYYPLDLFFDLADRFLHINFSEPIIDIPNIYEPTTNTILIHATKFNFNTLLEQNSLKTAHDIYLIIVDAIIYVGLVILLYNKYEEVMTK